MVDGVNNNTGIYTGAGLATGAIAGGLGGYMTKPYLEKDAPKDSFVKTVQENFISGQIEKLNKGYDEQLKELEKIEDAEGMKKFLTEGFTKAQEEGSKNIEEIFGEGTEKLKKDDIADFFGKQVDEAIASGKKIEDLKAESKKSIETVKEIINGEEFSKALKEVNSEETIKAGMQDLFKDGKLLPFEERKGYSKAMYETIEKAVSHSKLKAAALYGSIAAGVGAVVGYIAGRMSAPKAEDAALAQDAEVASQTEEQPAQEEAKA